MNRFSRLIATATFGIATGAVAPLAHAQKNDPGVEDKQVIVCSYQPMTGNVSSYFRMGKGADAWFKHVNDSGGINGRKIDFRMVDDQYEPARTVPIVKRFIERDNCFAIVSPLGSAPTAAVVDYIVEQKVPLIGAGTGAAKVLEYPSKWVFPLYPSYKDEGKALVRFSKEVFKARTIGVLYQNDPAGKTHMEGIKSVLDQEGVRLLAEQGYEPKEVDLSAQVLALKNANPDAIICSCAPEPAAKFYTERKKLGWKAPVVNVFFGKSPKVAELAGNDAVEGVYFATIFRDFNSQDKAIVEARDLLKKYYPEEQPDEIHLWGFTGAQIFTEALRRMGRDNLTRERLVESLEGIKDWKGSVVPQVTIYKGNAPEHFMVRDISYVVFRAGKFEEFTPPWQK